MVRHLRKLREISLWGHRSHNFGTLRRNVTSIRILVGDWHTGWCDVMLVVMLIVVAFMGPATCVLALQNPVVADGELIGSGRHYTWPLAVEGSHSDSESHHSEASEDSFGSAASQGSISGAAKQEGDSSAGAASPGVSAAERHEQDDDSSSTSSRGEFVDVHGHRHHHDNEEERHRQVLGRQQ